jgi:hypothetical protein
MESGTDFWEYLIQGVDHLDGFKLSNYITSLFLKLFIMFLIILTANTT